MLERRAKILNDRKETLQREQAKIKKAEEHAQEQHRRQEIIATKRAAEKLSNDITADKKSANLYIGQTRYNTNLIRAGFPMHKCKLVIPKILVTPPSESHEPTYCLHENTSNQDNNQLCLPGAGNELDSIKLLHTPRNVSNSHKQTCDGILAVGDYYVDKEQLASKLSEMQKVGMCDGVKEILGSDCPELMVIKRSRQQPVVSLDEVPIPPSAPHFEPTTPPQQTSKQPPLRRSAAFGSQELESSSDSCNQGIRSKRYQGTSRQDFLIIADQYSKNHKLNLTNQLGLSPRPSAMSRPRVPVKQTTKIGTHILKKSTTSTTISTLYISNSATVSNKGMSSADTLSTKRGNTEQGNTERGNTEQGNTEQGNTEQGNTEQGNTERGNTELTSRIRPLSRSTSEQSEQQRREHMMAPGGGTRRRCYSTSNLPNLRTTDVTRSRPSTTDNTASRPNSRAIATVEEHPYCKEKPLDIRFLKWALDGAVTELPPSYSKNRTRVYFA